MRKVVPFHTNPPQSHAGELVKVEAPKLGEPALFDLMPDPKPEPIEQPTEQVEQPTEQPEPENPIEYSGNRGMPHQDSKPWKFDPINFTISQSLYKAYMDYQYGAECGIVFFEREIKRNPSFAELERQKDTEAKRLGRYFEYIATGYANPNEGIIEPEYYKVNGEGFKKGDLKPMWANAQRQADNFHSILKAYGLTIVGAGLYRHEPNSMIRGLIDVVAKCELEAQWENIVRYFYTSEGREEFKTFPKYEECIFVDTNGVEHQGCIQIDLKYSGLLRDKWNELGWHPEQIEYNKRTAIQAKTYAYLTGLPFYYFVFGSKDQDVLVYRMWMAEGALEEHKNKMVIARKEIINMVMLEAFQARPDYSRCIECPLFSNCEHRLEVPPIRGVPLWKESTR